MRKKHRQREGGERVFDPCGVENPEWDLKGKSQAPLMAVAALYVMESCICHSPHFH